MDQLVSRVGPKTRLIILNYPHNPTGGTIPESGLRAIAERGRQARRAGAVGRDLRAHPLRRGAPSIAAMPGMEPLAIVLDGFSKTYAMTGWRLGYGIMPAPMAQVVAKLQTNATSCTATFTQMAGVDRAARRPVVGRRAWCAEFRRRRDVIVDGLRQIPGFTCVRPQGRLLRLPQHHGHRLLVEAAVATSCSTRRAWPACPAPPSASSARATCASRYANSMENIDEALKRIRAWVEAQKGRTVPLD